MNDELKRCANCSHEHRWGILRYSQDGVPLYGARPCEWWHDYSQLDMPGFSEGNGRYCGCDRFAEKQEGDPNLPALTNEQTKQLWEQTSFMNAQAPAATRMVVAKLMALGEGKGEPSWLGKLFGRGDAKTALERQWPEFVGFIISQITDMRGAMVRDESKFAHLVSHTDEIVEAMRSVTQLAERLDNIYSIQERMLEAIGKLSNKVDALEDAQAAAIDKASLTEAAHVFASKSAPLWNEAIPTDSEPAEKG